MMGKLIFILSIFLLTSSVSFWLIKVVLKRRAINQRIDRFLPTNSEDEAEQPTVKQDSKLKQMFSAIAGALRDVQFSNKTKKLLIEAGSPLKPEEFFIVRVLVFFLIGIGAFLIGFPWFIWIIGASIGYMLPVLFMKRKREKRIKMISYQLIEILGMMSNSMRAGFSFMQAMQLVAKEMPEPLGPEFEQVVKQAGLGVPLDDVFKDMTERLPNKELEVVVRAILAQRKSGGNLAALMETMEETVRGRIRVLEELNTLTAQGRMSSWIITLLPVGLGLYLALMNREYFGPMLDHPLGMTMLTLAGLSILLGWFFIQKIIKIEV